MQGSWGASRRAATAAGSFRELRPARRVDITSWGVPADAPRKRAIVRIGWRESPPSRLDPPSQFYISSSSRAQDGRYGCGLGLELGVVPGVIGRGGALLGVLTPMGLAGRGAMPPPPMPGAGGVIGFGAAGIAGLAGAGAIGFGAAGIAGFDTVVFAAAFRAGALRAEVLRAEVLRAEVLRAGFRAAVLRAEVLRAVALRAVARFAPVFLAPVLRAVLRTARPVLRAVLRPARAVFRALLRGLAFLLVVRFFPLVLVAMVSAPILL